MVNLYTEISDEILKSEIFQEDYVVLQKSALYSNDNLGLDRIKRLLQSSAILSLSENEEHLKLAYKIAIFCLETNKLDLEVYRVVEIVLLRLGNFPAISHLLKEDRYKDLFGIKEKPEETISYSLFREFLIKKQKNLFILNNIQSYLTDFQAEILETLCKKKNLSFSAPTSAGKSFLLSTYIARLMSQPEKKRVVYLVPTRALVSQVQKDIISSLVKYNINAKIFSVSQDILELDLGKEEKTIFVLTQERLETIISNINQDLNIDLLIIDEAQKIGDGDRGIRLESVIKDLVELNRDMQTVFISPFAKNPETFRDLFGIDLVVKKSSISPVSNNIFLINFKEREVNVSLLSKEINKTLDFYNVNIPKKVPDNYRKKIWVLENIVKGNEQTLIYCDTPGDCRRIANTITSSGSIEDSEINSAMEFIREHIHEEYELIDLLNNGIAFHYSRMPSFVKLYVEELFRRKKIKNLCATSTIVEGINLPAKNMIIYKPKKGRTKQMDDLTFLNLMGRAGRLTKDFYGNIYCVDIQEWEACKDALKNPDYLIEVASEKTLKDKINQIRNYLKEHEVVDSDVQALVIRFIINQIRKGKIGGNLKDIIQGSRNLSEQDLQNILDSVRDITDSLELDPKIILKNPSIDPRLQNKMFLKLKEMKVSDIPLPLNVYNKDFYDNLRGIYKLISQIFMGVDNESYSYFTLLSNKWIKESTYKELLLSKLKFKHGEEYGRDEVNKAIEELNADLEDKLRFEYSRYLKCYTDILEYLIYKSNLTIKISPLHNYLDSGASDKRTLSLIKVGLSRSTSIFLKNIMPKDLEDPNKCIEWMRKNLGFIKNNCPYIYSQEVKLFLEGD